MSLVKRPQFRVGFAFWLFGLINNVLYVIILTAAVDLVPASTPKSVVLLADNFPALLAKLSGPYFIHRIPYGVRISVLAAMSLMAMLSVASMESITARLMAVGVASAASGWGEMSCLALTHYYPGGIALAGFSSGTGVAGLAGAGAYALLTTTFGLSSRTTIYYSSFLPLITVLAYFVTLPKTTGLGEYQNVAQTDEDESGPPPENEHDSVESESTSSVSRANPALESSGSKATFLSGLKANFKRIRKLIYPYMLPLFIVYTAEYIIISGVAPNLLFPVEESPFKALRDFYPAYNAVYQLGVFISRSSILFFRLTNIYRPSLLQIVNLAILTLHALFFFIPNVWFVFIVYFWTGLLGGAVYVNTFAKITDEVSSEEREFSLGAVSVADTLGIMLATFVSMPLEPVVCAYQARHGREWCKQV